MDFYPTIWKLWLGEYDFKFRDWHEARKPSICLYDSIGFSFSDD